MQTDTVEIISVESMSTPTEHLSTRMVDASSQTEVEGTQLEYVNKTLLRQIREYEEKLKVSEERMRAMIISVARQECSGHSIFSHSVTQMAESSYNCAVTKPPQFHGMRVETNVNDEGRHFSKDVGSPLELPRLFEGKTFHEIVTRKNAETTSAELKALAVKSSRREITSENAKIIDQPHERNNSTNSWRGTPLNQLHNSTIKPKKKTYRSKRNGGKNRSGGASNEAYEPDDFPDENSIYVEGMVFPDFKQKLLTAFSQHGIIEKFTAKRFKQQRGLFKAYIQFSHSLNDRAFHQICKATTIIRRKRPPIKLVIDRKRSSEQWEDDVATVPCPISTGVNLPSLPFNSMRHQSRQFQEDFGRQEKQIFRNGLYAYLPPPLKNVEGRQQKCAESNNYLAPRPGIGFRNSRTVHVSGLCIHDPENAITYLQCMLSVYGKIEKVAVVTDSKSGKTDGYVQFSAELSETQLEHLQLHMKAAGGKETRVQMKTGAMVHGNLKFVNFTV